MVNVKDNGIGIKPDLLDKVFEPLFSTKSKNAKSGAGLSLSKDLLKTDYNATIEVSTDSEFTTFTIKFPLFCFLEASNLD
ncbi:MAG: ATP-binding protein [Crocosphaera sp.]